MMKKLFYTGSLSLLLIAVACQSPATKEAVKGQQLAQEAIALHDDIMPHIASFDQATVKIDSILRDTTVTHEELIGLKQDLEQATDNMMTWMHEYAAHSTDVAYQQAEVDKVKAMKKQFEDVAASEHYKKLSSSR